jgi:hypothetical protein
MHLRSSSTSSSEADFDQGDPLEGRGGSGMRDLLAVSAWIIVSLIAIDITVNVLFPIPTDLHTQPSRLQTYFDHGRSIEGKIRRMVGPTDETSAPIVEAGWLDKAVRRPDIPDRPKQAGGLLITVYGMSYTNQLCDAMVELDPTLTLRRIHGPGSPASHSYAAYTMDRGGQSDIVILGVLGSSVMGIATNTYMTWRFEGPAPYTYPRYTLDGSNLEARWPMVRTLGQMRQTLADPALWAQYVAQIRAEDDFYDTFVFNLNLTDSSALVRLFRRAWAQRHERLVADRFRTSAGFVQDSDVIRTLNALVASFAETARRDGKLPLVVLFQDRDYKDQVYRALAQTLHDKSIPFVSTHTICPTTNPQCFVADNHFTKDANRMIARAVLDTIHRNRPRSRLASHGE